MIRATSLAVAAMLLLGCGSRPGPDYGPIGDGMKMIGICLVLSALVGALAGLIAGNDEED
ncbi:MAG: hypothetical protein AAF591_09430 [Verrucomicrobiota bacterium]